MRRTSKISVLCATALLLVVLAGNSMATDVPSDAVVLERIWNDSFASILTVTNSFP